MSGPAIAFTGARPGVCLKRHSAGRVKQALRVRTSHARDRAQTDELESRLQRLLIDTRGSLDQTRIHSRIPDAPDPLWQSASDVTDAMDRVTVARPVMFESGELRTQELASMGGLLQNQMIKIRGLADETASRLAG